MKRALKHGWMTITGAVVLGASYVLDTLTSPEVIAAVQEGRGLRAVARVAIGIGLTTAIIGARRAMSRSQSLPPDSTPRTWRALTDGDGNPPKTITTRDE